jgi:hypothetical protein
MRDLSQTWEKPRRLLRALWQNLREMSVVSVLPTDYALLPEGDKSPTVQDPENQVDSINRLTDNRFEEIRLEWQKIARSEVTRHHRNLALSAEQVREVETALVAVTDGLFERLLGNVSVATQRTCLKIWRCDELVVS